jgi:hypothetical protein
MKKKRNLAQLVRAIVEDWNLDKYHSSTEEALKI